MNEGPAGLSNGTKYWISYSASYCEFKPMSDVLYSLEYSMRAFVGWTSSYSLGLLEWTGGNPTSAASWIKSGPVFTSADGDYGPGHNGWFLSPDGTETWIVYHASLSDPAACDGTRVTMAQKYVLFMLDTLYRY